MLKEPSVNFFHGQLMSVDLDPAQSYVFSSMASFMSVDNLIRISSEKFCSLINISRFEIAAVLMRLEELGYVAVYQQSNKPIYMVNPSFAVRSVIQDEEEIEEMQKIFDRISIGTMTIKALKNRMSDTASQMVTIKDVQGTDLECTEFL